MQALMPQQYRWLMEGLKTEQPKANKAVPAGAVSRGTDAGRAIYQAAGTGETGSGRSVGMGK